MPSVNIRQLCDTRQLKAWLLAGETVELRERDRIIPESLPPAPQEWRDFVARVKNLRGTFLLPSADLLMEERGRY